MAFWVAGEDTLCDGRELLNRFERGREPGVRVLEGGWNVVEGYSHLDVVWACDVIERVGEGVRDAVWRCVGSGSGVDGGNGNNNGDGGRERWRVPRGCEGVEAWVDDRVFGNDGGLGLKKREESASTDLEDSESEREKESEVGEKKVVSDKETVD